MSDQPLEEDQTFIEILPHPIELLPEHTFLVSVSPSAETRVHSSTEFEEIYLNVDPNLIMDGECDNSIESDEAGKHIEVCFTDEVVKAILEEHQEVVPGEVATLRVYVTNAATRSVVIKDDDILTKDELQAHAMLPRPSERKSTPG